MADRVGVPSQISTLLAAELSRASDNVEVALDTYLKALETARDIPTADRTALLLRVADCLIETRQYSRVRDYLSELLSVDTETVSRARAVARCGWAEFFLGNLSEAISLCAEAVDALASTAHHDDLAEALRWLGYGYRFTGRTHEAAETFRDAVAAARRGKDPAQQAFCLEALAQVKRLQGRYSDTVDLHRASLAVNERRGARKYVAFDWFHIGLSQIYLGEWSAARESLDRATRLFVELGDDRAQIPVLIALCRLERRLGEPSSAREHAERALALARESSYKRAIVLANEELADLQREAGNMKEAAALLEAALVDGTAIAPEGDLVYEVAWRLALAIMTRDPSRAEELAARAVRLARAAGDRREIGSASVALARVCARGGRVEEALRFAEDGLREFEAIETPFELAGAHEAAADVLLSDRSRTSDVVAHLLEARRLHSRLGAAHEVERLDGLVAAQAAALDGAKHPRAAKGPSAPRILSFDARMATLFATARDFAPYETTVLVEGETGSGKEIVSRLLHDAGPRASRPFVALNCAAFPAALLESELFGHRRGAFTGADRDYRGRLAAAEDGTVLLDEIDKASPEFGAKLLRVIEDRRVFPVGSTESVPLRARLVCATNRDLRVLAVRGAFLQDLYFRLAAFRLRIPPLRERPDDIRGFVGHYLEACVGRFGSDSYAVSRDAMRALLAYPWPGNVRELKNVIESAAFFARLGGVIELAHLPHEIVDAIGQPGHASLPERIEELERSQIDLALNKAGGNKSDAARILGVSRKGLLDRLRRLGLE